MRVRIDSSGNDKFAVSINGLVESTGDLLQVLSNKCDGGTFHENIGCVRVDSSHNMSAPDEGFHRGKYNRKLGVRGKLGDAPPNSAVQEFGVRPRISRISDLAPRLQ